MSDPMRRGLSVECCSHSVHANEGHDPRSAGYLRHSQSDDLPENIGKRAGSAEPWTGRTFRNLHQALQYLAECPGSAILVVAKSQKARWERVLEQMRSQRIRVPLLCAVDPDSQVVSEAAEGSLEPEPLSEAAADGNSSLCTSKRYRLARMAFEREFFIQALAENGGSVRKAAEATGVSRRLIQIKASHLGIDLKDMKQDVLNERLKQSALAHDPNESCPDNPQGNLQPTSLSG
jgi:hypothetical protein